MRTLNHSPSFRSFSVSLAAVLWALAVAGCSSGTDGGGAAAATSSVSAAEASDFCDTYCRKTATCDSRRDVQTCSAKCEDGISSYLRRLRPDLVEGTRTCFESSDCRQVLESQRLPECLAEAALSVTPSKAAMTYCDAFIGAADECFGIDVPRAACLDHRKTYSDATLAEATRCMTKSCKQRFDCDTAVLGSE